jgi:hypothetical protein
MAIGYLTMAHPLQQNMVFASAIDLVGLWQMWEVNYAVSSISEPPTWLMDETTSFTSHLRSTAMGKTMF